MNSDSVSHPRGKALRSSPFRYAHGFMLFGRARLYEDCIVFSALTLRGRHKRTVMLRDIREVKWWTGDQKVVNLALHLHNGTPVKVWIKGCGLWKYTIDQQLGHLLSLQHDLPGEMTAASAA